MGLSAHHIELIIPSQCSATSNGEFSRMINLEPCNSDIVGNFRVHGFKISLMARV